MTCIDLDKMRDGLVTFKWDIKVNIESQSFYFKKMIKSSFYNIIK